MTSPGPPTGRERWAAAYARAQEAGPGRDADLSTLSGVEVDPVYGPADDAADERMERIGWPGEFPFTRGLYPTGYRGRPWTIRQFAGFGNARQTNERYRMILDAGGGGLSVAFDMPTLMGRDSDDPRSLGEVGHCGVAVDSAADLETLFAGIDLGAVTTSMTISGPAVPMFCLYVVAAERQGVDPAALNGTLQTDIFKEYIAQKEWLFAPEPHLRLIGDLMEYCARGIPKYKPLSVSGYHIREAGQTAGVSLTAQQPVNNVVRTAVEALAAVLGGTNSLHTNALDETLALPTDESAEIALRTQQVLMEETGVVNVADPLGGSWYVEALTDKIEAEAEEIVGVNCHTGTVAKDLEILRISHEVELEQRRVLAERKSARDEAAVQAAVARMVEVSRTDGNMIPAMLDAVRAEATLGEICDALRAEWGIY